MFAVEKDVWTNTHSDFSSQKLELNTSDWPSKAEKKLKEAKLLESVAREA